VRFTIWDCGGQELRSGTRNLILSQASVLLLCYSMADPSSLLSLVTAWLTELRLSAVPTTPVLLVGCKSDRREVEREQVGIVSSQLQAMEALETSAKLSERSVKLLFDAAFAASRKNMLPPPSFVSPQAVKRRSQSASRDLMSTRVSPVLMISTGLMMNDSPTLSKTSSLGSVRSKSSTLSSTKSDSSMISISTSRTPRVRRRGDVREDKEKGEKTVRIRCGRLNNERVYEEVEIEIPLSVYNNMQTESPAISSRNSSERKSLANRLKSLFIQ
jgi:hypothetical protein